MPIKQYLKRVCDIDFNNLREYVTKYGYGTPIKIKLSNHEINLIPVAHPRQIGGLGHSSKFWFDEHKKWEQMNKF